MDQKAQKNSCIQGDDILFVAKDYDPYDAFMSSWSSHRERWKLIFY